MIRVTPLGRVITKAYRWKFSTVTTIQHGSHLTRNKAFNGYDIVVDFIAGASDGRAHKIVSIKSKTAFTVTCEVEDRPDIIHSEVPQVRFIYSVVQLSFKSMKMIHCLILQVSFQVTFMQT